MFLHKDKDVKEVAMDMEGAVGVVKRVLIGPQEGSDDTFMRLFTMKPGGHTPKHSHPYPHLIKWLSGMGVILDGEGKENKIEVNMSAFVPKDEEHQFRNPSDYETCSFICVIPNPDKVEK